MPPEDSNQTDPFPPSHRPRYRERQRAFVAAISLMATVPVWLARYPPLVDLPQHMAQIALLRNLHDPGFGFAQLFEVHWFTPYLIGYMAVYVLAPLLGLMTAGKVVLSAALAGLPVGTALLLEETGGDAFWAVLTIPCMYGFSYEWGFLNFLVAVPIGLAFLVVIMRNLRVPQPRGQILAAILAALLFFSHALMFALSALAAGAYVLLESRNVRRTARAMLPVACLLPIAVFWYLRIQRDARTHISALWDLDWFHPEGAVSLGGRLNGFLPRLLGVEASAICLLMGAFLFLLPLLAGARPAKRVAVWTPLFIVVCVLLLCPTSAMGTDFLYQRFTVLALPFYLSALSAPRAIPPLARTVAVVFVMFWVVLLGIRTLRCNADAQGFATILDAMEPNQRALSVIFNPWPATQPAGQPPSASGGATAFFAPVTDLVRAPIFLHYPAWYSATRMGVVDVSFAMVYSELVVYRSDRMPAVNLGFELEPETFSWSRVNGGLYRYFILRALVDPGRSLFRDAPCRVALVARSGEWWLYEKDPQCTVSSSPAEWLPAAVGVRILVDRDRQRGGVTGIAASGHQGQVVASCRSAGIGVCRTSRTAAATHQSPEHGDDHERDQRRCLSQLIFPVRSRGHEEGGKCDPRGYASPRLRP